MFSGVAGNRHTDTLERIKITTMSMATWKFVILLKRVTGTRQERRERRFCVHRKCVTTLFGFVSFRMVPRKDCYYYYLVVQTNRFVYTLR